MTPREVVESVLRGELAVQVPFTAWENNVPRSAAERQLRNDGLCLVMHSPPVFKRINNEVQKERFFFRKNDITYERIHLITPEGELTEIKRYNPEKATSWHVERLFKDSKDYIPLLAMIQDQSYLPNYEEFNRMQELVGGDVFLLPSLGYSPMQYIMYTLMGLELFAREWATRRPQVLLLYRALVKNHRHLYPIATGSPAPVVNYGGVNAKVVGRERFENYFMPPYNEFADFMHAKGKLVGIHLDGDMRPLAEAIQGTRIDFIESFNSHPEGGLSVADARVLWPDKVLWVDLPPSVHLQTVEAIEEATRQLLVQADSGEKFLIGITDHVPEDRWEANFAAILRVVNQEGKLPLNSQGLLGPSPDASGAADAGHADAHSLHLSG